MVESKITYRTSFWYRMVSKKRDGYLLWEGRRNELTKLVLVNLENLVQGLRGLGIPFLMTIKKTEKAIRSVLIFLSLYNNY